MQNEKENGFEAERRAMLKTVAAHARDCGRATGRPALSDRVMQAMANAPRHRFMPADLQPYAYRDMPLPIGSDKTISQPFMVALATDLLDIAPDDKILEVGAGLGYQAAVLAELSDHVFAVEILSELGEEAERRLAEAGYGKVRIRIGDGSRGWPEEAPFDKILVSAGAKKIPAALIDQLKAGGRMVIPAGEEDTQMLRLVEKDQDGELTDHALIPVRYSPLTLSH